MKFDFGMVLSISAAAMVCSACGVRGRPQPPLTPAELGRGQPTFKRSTEEYAFPNVPAPESEAAPTPRPSPSPHRDGK